jgi:hypothetical protein
MKKALFALLLTLSVACFGQGRGQGGGRPSGAPAQGPAMGAGGMGQGGAGMGQAGGHEHPSSQAGQASRSRPADVGKQSPATVLERNEKLSSRLDSILPSGMTAQQACTGFKNLGDCVSAIHVSKNLDIPFDTLKARLTGSNATSLGSAIHALKPDADAKSEVSKARKQAQQDLREAQP